MPTNLNNRNAIDNQPDRMGQILKIPIIVLLSVIAAAAYEPALGLWVSDAAQAEFVGSDSAPLIAETEPQSSYVALVKGSR